MEEKEKLAKEQERSKNLMNGATDEQKKNYQEKEAKLATDMDKMKRLIDEDIKKMDEAKKLYEKIKEENQNLRK